MSEENNSSSMGWFLAGLGFGALVGVLFAPKTGSETREYIANRANEGKRSFPSKRANPWGIGSIAARNSPIVRNSRCNQHLRQAGRPIARRRATTARRADRDCDFEVAPQLRSHFAASNFVESIRKMFKLSNSNR